MSEFLKTTLAELRDVEGVLGSAALRGDGSLQASDLPAYFDAGVLDEVGQRVKRLYEVWQSLGNELDATSLVFADHRLHLRRLPAGFLVVVSGNTVNAPALKMAMRLVGRKLGRELAMPERTAVPPSAATTAPVPRGPRVR